MTALPPEELEGKLNAHRELMIDLIAAILGAEEALRGFGRRLADDASFEDHEEDPGAVPAAGVALQSAAAMEIRAILEAAKARAEALRRMD